MLSMALSLGPADSYIPDFWFKDYDSFPPLFYLFHIDSENSSSGHWIVALSQDDDCPTSLDGHSSQSLYYPVLPIVILLNIPTNDH